MTEAWSTVAVLSSPSSFSFPIFKFPGSVRRVGESGPQVNLGFATSDRSSVEALFTADEQHRTLDIEDPGQFVEFFEARPSQLPLVAYYEQNRVFPSTDTTGFVAVSSEENRKTPDRPERTLFLEKGGADIPFESLSGGEQAFFMLAVDLARRLMLDRPDKPAADPWLGAMLARKPKKLVAVAQANRTARIVWATMSKRQSYRAPAPNTA